MSTNSVKIKERLGLFPKRCPPELQSYEQEYCKIVRDANRFMRKRLLLSLLGRISFIASTLIAMAALIVTIGLGLRYKSLALAIGGGIGSLVIGIPLLLIVGAVFKYMDEKILKEYNEFMENQKYSIEIKLDRERYETYSSKGKIRYKYRECILFTIPSAPSENENKV